MAQFWTTHRGIAAFLITKGHQIVDATTSLNKDNRPVVKIEFDVDRFVGKDLGDDFMNGSGGMGNLKAFYDALHTVNVAIVKARRTEESNSSS